MTRPFLSELKGAVASAPAVSWAVSAAPYAARYALGAGPIPTESDGSEVAHARSIARRFGRIPASHTIAAPGSFGATLVAAVRDDTAFVRLFAPLFGAALFGLERSERSAALGAVPTQLRAHVRREFELLRNGGVRPDIERSALFEPSEACHQLRRWVGARVARTLGVLIADELAVLCGGWGADWRVPAVGSAVQTALADAWLQTFDAGGRHV